MGAHFSCRRSLLSMKTCTTCCLEFEATSDNFYTRTTERGTKYLAAVCKTCEKLARVQYHRANRYSINRTARARVRRNAEFVALQRAKPCERCGFERMPSINQFHHRRGQQKLFKLSSPGTRSIARLEAEQAKCELICPNCHAIEHVDAGDFATNRRVLDA